MNLSQSFGQECIPRGSDLFIHADLLVDRSYDWWCDTWVDDGVTVTIVDGGSILGSPRFQGASHLVMTGGHIQELSTGSGYPWALISGGTSDNLAIGNVDHQSVISGGDHQIVGGSNLEISGGHIKTLVSSGGIVYFTGGSIEAVDRGYVFWSGGMINGVENTGTETIVTVQGTGLDFSDRRLTGTLLDGSSIDWVFSHGTFLLADKALIEGDANRDGLVGLDDLNGIRNNFGSEGISISDVNFDDHIDLADLNIVRNNFGKSATQSVSEPSSLAISVLLVISLQRWHRRKNSAPSKTASSCANPSW